METTSTTTENTTFEDYESYKSKPVSWLATSPYGTLSVAQAVIALAYLSGSQPEAIKQACLYAASFTTRGFPKS